MDSPLTVQIPKQDLNDLLNPQHHYQPEKEFIEVTGEQLLIEDVQEMEFLLHPILPKTGVATVAGASDTGKSMFLRHLGISLVAGEEYFAGFPFNATHRSSIYLSSEDGREATAFLLQRQANSYLPKVLKNLRFIFDYEDLLQNWMPPLRLNPQTL